MFSHKADRQIAFAFDYKENIISLLHVLEHYCQSIVIGINSTSTGMPNLRCIEAQNYSLQTVRYMIQNNSENSSAVEQLSSVAAQLRRSTAMK